LSSDFSSFRAASAVENRTLKRALTDPSMVSGIGNPPSCPLPLRTIEPQEWLPAPMMILTPSVCSLCNLGEALRPIAEARRPLHPNLRSAQYKGSVETKMLLALPAQQMHSPQKLGAGTFEVRNGWLSPN